MSNKEFWDETPELLWAYRKSYMEKIKTQKEIINYTAWLNGLYVFDAVSKSVYNSFGRKNGQHALNYIEEPYNISAKSKSKEELEREERLRIEEKIKERNREIKKMLSKK